MRRMILLVMTLILALGTAGAVSANGGGVSPEKLEEAGWDCFMNPMDPSIVPCVKDLEAVFAGEGNTHTVLTFKVQTDGTVAFLGTELFMHQDLYNGQPCPQDEVSGGDVTYIDLSGLGLDYFVCHHFESPLT
jgi:hypothetical protein